MHACNKGEKDTYRREFGRHLFGNADFFPGTAKYTLEPLRTAGRASIVCTVHDFRVKLLHARTGRTEPSSARGVQC